ncbi:carbohydrate ABC transporter permease [Dictyobacter aurantiacus]|uniref:Sugar ABC transporter permease n=1 Tax=Dictyobacter aurantiacus TaxID=1936993 RepID=A0A401ZCA2_9CHLR|nr:sugar ABC transporter permease [Dictyobacter aurantiacus]GCE04462.1 sugar ABC transporter permease [Dictyobacter aurantiacus]
MEYQVSSLGVAKQGSSRNNLRRRQMSEAFWGYFFILPQMIGLVAFALIPLIMVFVYSANNWDGLGAFTFVGFQNYIDQFNSPDLHIALWNTLYYTILTVPGGLILALLAALGLNNVRGKTVYRVIYFMPVVTSSVAVAVIWGWLLNSDFGLINVLLKDWFHIHGPGWITDSRFVLPSIALLSIWSSLGFNMIIFLAGLQGIPATYAEAARIDGANRLQLFFGVTLPMLTPTLFFTTVLSVISSFQVFDQAFVLTGGGPGKDSYTIVYHMYHLAFEQNQFGEASSAAVILFAILLVLTLLQLGFQRRWVTYDV